MSIPIERERSTRGRFGAHALAISLASALAAGCATEYDSRAVGESAEQYLRDRYITAAAAPDAPDGDDREHLYARAELGEYVAFALVHHKALEAAYERWRAAAESVGVVSALPNPRLTYGEFIEEIQTRTGPQRRSLGVTQAFPWPGMLDAKAEVAVRRADVLRQKLESERLAVQARVSVAFHDYAFLADETAITGSVLDLVRSLEPVVQARVRAGAGQEDLLRLQVEIGRLEDDAQRLNERRRVLSARLADAMNLPHGDSRLLPMPSQADVDTQRADAPGVGAGRDDERVLAHALDSNPHLLMLIENLRVARAGRELAGFANRPDFSIGLKYFDTGDARASSTNGSGDDPLLLSVSMGLPVWTSSYAAARRRADHLVRTAQAELAAARSAVHAEAVEALFQISDAERRMRLYRETLLPRAREAVQLTMAAYRAGRATVLDLLDSERALLEFELIYRRAIRDQRQGAARLAQITGGPDA